MGNSRSWPKGVSGNPNGRPKKERALTAILERAGSASLEIDGKRIAGKRWVAEKAWEVMKFGRVTLPDGRVLQVGSVGEWLDVVKWAYAQIDGPVQPEIPVKFSGNVNTTTQADVNIDTGSELAEFIRAMADAGYIPAPKPEDDQVHTTPTDA
jgi:hypothetical protein